MVSLCLIAFNTFFSSLQLTSNISLDIVEESRRAIPKIHNVTFSFKKCHRVECRSSQSQQVSFIYIYSSQDSQTWWKSSCCLIHFVLTGAQVVKLS